MGIYRQKQSQSTKAQIYIYTINRQWDGLILTIEPYQKSGEKVIKKGL